MPIAVEAADLQATFDPVSLILAALALLGGWILSRVARRGVRNLAGRLDGVSPEVSNMAARIAGYTVLFIAFGVALAFLGAEIQPLLATVILVAVVLALAMRGIAENFAAGILLQTRRPITVGDEIVSLEHEGTVTEMNGRSVVIETLDGRRVHLPNTEVLSNPLVNNTVLGHRRSEIEVRAAAAEAKTVADILHESTRRTSGVLDDPNPLVLFTSIEPGRVVVLLRLWHTPADGAQVRSDLIANIAMAIAERGLEGTVMAPPPVAALTPPAVV